MPRTRLQIIQGAFTAMVGGNLTSENDPNAQPITLIYDSIVDDALLIETWPWTLARGALQRDPAPDHPEAYRFTLPSAMPAPQGQPADVSRERLSVGPLAVYDSSGAKEATTQPWRLEGPYIYSDAEALWALLQFHAPETTWPVQFAEYIRLRLCAEVVGVYRPDEGAQLSVIYERRAEAKLGQVIDSVQQVEGPQVIFERFQTTSERIGDHLRPIRYNADGQALP